MNQPQSTKASVASTTRAGTTVGEIEGGTQPEWPTLAPASLSDAAYLAVRDQIVAGRIAPGEFIRERAVGAALRVSRTPLREALGRLATEGFLERLPNHGFRVSPTPIQDLLDLYPIVAALEVLAAGETLPRLAKPDIDRLRLFNRQMHDAISSHEAAEAIRVNEAFHQLLTARSGNRRLGKLLADLRSQLRSLEVWSATKPELATEAVEQHRSIIQAVVRRDFASAVKVLEANRMQTWETLTTQHQTDRRADG